MEQQPGQPHAAILRLAFWEALKRCEGDERVHDMDLPYNADDPMIDGRLPEMLWEHMERALAELRDAAGL